MPRGRREALGPHSLLLEMEMIRICVIEDRWCERCQKQFQATVVIEKSDGKRTTEETPCWACG
jgi:hypothetical protein